MKAPAPCLPSSDTTPEGAFRCHITAPQEWKSRVPHTAFLGRGGSGTTVFLGLLAGGGEWDCREVVCHVRLPLSWSFDQREQVFIGIFFVCVCCHFQIAGFFSSKRGIYEAKRSPRHLATVLFLRPPASELVGLFCLPFRAWCVLCVESRVLVVLVRGVKAYLLPSPRSSSLGQAHFEKCSLSCSAIRCNIPTCPKYFVICDL